MGEKITKIQSLAELNKIKEEEIRRMSIQDGVRIVVGLGTCGVAAGAQPVYDAIAAYIKENGMQERVLLEETGCVGICQYEPGVEVYEPNIRTTYVHMTVESAIRVMKQHIQGGNPIAEFTIGSSKNRR